MSFKYRFILSFVLLEVFFIVLIVSINFVTINNSSKQLNNDKIESTISFLEQLLVVPLSIYDLATLDNLVENSKKQKYINSIIILDKQDRVLSKRFKFEHLKLDKLLEIKENKKFSLQNENYELKIKKILEDGLYIGSIYLIFDTSESIQFIKSNKEKTFFIIIFEIIISTLLAYFIGSRLTKMLSKLAQVAQDIGENKHPTIPYQDKNDEIGTLSKSMNKMQVDIKSRNTVLQKQKLDLEESNQYKDDFLANMSHELKTPLNSINIISSVMSKNKHNDLNEKQVKNLNIISSAGKDLLGLINDILDVSKMEEGKVPIYFDKVDLPALINELYDVMKPLAKNQEIQLEKNILLQDNFVITDNKRVKQIIQNLLSNAIKFTPKGCVSLNVKQDKENIIIEVVDSGIGIKKDKLSNIFDRFKQADGSTTRKYGGTGLGLAISKKLAEFLNGNLSVKSTIGEGSTFTFSFPKNSDITVNDEDKIENVKSNISNQTESEFMDIEIFHSDESKVTNNKKTKVILFNNNPVEFFSLIVALKREPQVELFQLKSLSEVLNKLDSSNINILILDIDTINDNLEDFKRKNLIPKIITISSTAQENSNDKRVFCKPIDVKLLVNAVCNKET